MEFSILEMTDVAKGEVVAEHAPGVEALGARGVSDIATDCLSCRLVPRTDLISI